MAGIEFKTTRKPYRCPTCLKMITVRPCPACIAREAATKKGQSLADEMLLAAGRRVEHAVEQASRTANAYDAF